MRRRTPRRLRAAAAACAAAWAGPACAGGLVVVHEEPGAVDARPHLGEAVSSAASRRALAAAGGRLAGRRVAFAPAYPVRAGRMAPGGGRSVRVARLSRPVFVLGAGHARWLRGEAARLRALGAVGYVVEARTPAAFEALREVAAAEGLLVVPAPGDAVADMLGVLHYPAVAEPAP